MPDKKSKYRNEMAGSLFPDLDMAPQTTPHDERPRSSGAPRGNDERRKSEKAGDMLRNPKI